VKTVLTKILFSIVLMLMADRTRGIEGDAHTLLLLHSENNLTGANNEARDQSSGVTFEPGVHGAAAYFSKSGATNTISMPGPLLFHPLRDGKFVFGGMLGRRIKANHDHWLLSALEANPGLLEMFRLRDRQPPPRLVPWAGEFAGKYLISAVQALRMTNSAVLLSNLTRFVADLIATQAEDGYLGPFPQSQRLLGNWDLWGHYHVMQGLLLWYEQTGDPSALRACRRAADLICQTYLDQPRRVFDAGSPEMNMAVIHVFGALHRLTGEARYLSMMREIEKDWERAGDYLRTGLAGVEYFATPRPRWESLHDVQGLVELWQITGEAKYREAFAHHWRSIARWDVHNTGAFSSGEQATGNPYSPGAIETCCTVAWMALSIDMLRLTGDSRIADQLELTTFNAALGAQHTSGRWWAYNTPMDGVREASAHSIVFQARAGTPELNCCSVNGPRALGMLSDWAVMADGNGVVINWHGPGEHTGKLLDGTPVRFTCATEFPVSGRVNWSVQLRGKPHRFPVRFRIPGWSAKAALRVNGKELNGVTPGQYCECNRLWKNGDAVEIDLDLSLRLRPGDREAAGKASLYRGPILLAYDQRFNTFDEPELPLVDPSRLGQARLVVSPRVVGEDSLSPALLIDLPTRERTLRLCDYASAGATGTRYQSWLPGTNLPPAPPITRAPADGAVLGAGQTAFRWTTKTNNALTDYRVLIGDSPELNVPALEFKNLTQSRFVLEDAVKKRLMPGRWYYWRVLARGPHGETSSAEPNACFQFDPGKPPKVDEREVQTGPNGLLVKAHLHGEPKPEFGKLTRATGFVPAPGPDGSPNGAVALNGKDQMLIYALPEDFGDDYSVTLWFRLTALPEKHLGQLFSAWAVGLDDPLRLTIDGGKLFARIEAQQAYSTKGVPIETGAWHHLAAVKSGPRLTLYLDGEPRESVAVPGLINTAARSCALGGNPNYVGNEFLAADFAGFVMFLKALQDTEVKELSRSAR